MMPELDVRGYLNYLIGTSLAEEAWATSLGFDSADAYQAEMDDHFDQLRYDSEDPLWMGQEDGSLA
jgi:hypothetical protein